MFFLSPPANAVANVSGCICLVVCVYVCVCVCVSVCLVHAVSLDLQTFLVCRYIFRTSRSLSLYQGHQVKVKVTGTRSYKHSCIHTFTCGSSSVESQSCLCLMICIDTWVKFCDFFVQIFAVLCCKIRRYLSVRRTLWSIFEAHAGTNGVLLQSQIRPLLNTIGLFPTHSQGLYCCLTDL